MAFSGGIPDERQRCAQESLDDINCLYVEWADICRLSETENNFGVFDGLVRCMIECRIGY